VLNVVAEGAGVPAFVGEGRKPRPAVRRVVGTGNEAFGFQAIDQLAARGETPTAFGRRCIPADCVAPPLNIPDIRGRRALSSGRLAALGATPGFHHGLL